MNQCCSVFVLRSCHVFVIVCVALVLYRCHKLWSRAIVQTSCTYDDLTLTNIQISTVVSWIRLMGLVKLISSIRSLWSSKV